MKPYFTNILKPLSFASQNFIIKESRLSEVESTRKTIYRHNKVHSEEINLLCEINLSVLLRYINENHICQNINIQENLI